MIYLNGKKATAAQWENFKQLLKHGIISAKTAPIKNGKINIKFFIK